MPGTSTLAYWAYWVHLKVAKKMKCSERGPWDSTIMLFDLVKVILTKTWCVCHNILANIRTGIKWLKYMVAYFVTPLKILQSNPPFTILFNIVLAFHFLFKNIWIVLNQKL